MYWRTVGVASKASLNKQTWFAKTRMLAPLCVLLLVHVAACFTPDMLYDVRWTMTSDLKGPQLPMTTAGGHKYSCFLPNQDEDGSDVEHPGLTQAHPMQLVSERSGQCLRYVEQYWSYEFCFGTHVRQYHDDRFTDEEGTRSLKTTEYFLARKPARGEFELLSEAPVIKYRDLNKVRRPYYSIKYIDGDVCDLGGVPRETEVQLICSDGRLSGIVRVEEVATCSYVVIVALPELCSSKDFVVTAVEKTPIVCVPRDGAPEIPPELNEIQAQDREFDLQVQEAREAQQKQSLEMLQRLNKDATKQELKQQFMQQNTQAHSHSRHQSQKQPSNSGHTHSSKPVDKFLSTKLRKGTHCFSGGGKDWWKFELCPNKHVRQYHKYPDGREDVILLGLWDEKSHREWYRHTQPDEGRTKDMTLLYTGGDFCDAIGATRQVQVKLRCSTTMPEGQVSLQLAERVTCKYVLTLRSPAVCELLDSADQDGVLRD
eukprot:m.29315 g.29315  ORF g.29315 m.29315 type:complete len:485 (-) comp9150_c0_seq1:1225-2679(-)